MDLENYEETRLPKEDSWAKFLKEGSEAQLLRWGDRVISVDLPKSVDLAVTETSPGVKGNTATGANRDRMSILSTEYCAPTLPWRLFFL